MKLGLDQRGGVTVETETVLPYNLSHRCPGCGVGETEWLTRLFRALWGKAPIATRGFGHCAGNKPPVDTADRHPVEAMLTGSKTREVRFLCAGINDPHLHITCARCGLQYLMHTATHAKE